MKSSQHDSALGIDRPILLLGTGRSGTTLSLGLLACHPHLAWISQYTNRFPRKPELALLSRIVDVEPASRLLGTRLGPRAVEANALLYSVSGGTFAEPRPLRRADLTSAARSRYRHVVRQHLHWQGKTRFLQKHTGFPRTEYLRAIFPDGRFVHVLRDGRAVAASMLHVDWWSGGLDSWWWGPMRPEFKEEYDASGQAPIVLAAIVWKTLIDLIEPAMQELPSGQALTVRYDDLLSQPEQTMAGLVDYCDLEPSPLFDRRLRQFRVAGSDDKWKRLPPEDRRLLEESLGDYLVRLGFA